MLVKALLAGGGAVLAFVVLLDGFHRAVAEVAGDKLADHALQSCPNWYLGVATGAFAVGLAWWATARR
jgi:hypothetical protein